MKNNNPVHHEDTEAHDLSGGEFREYAHRAVDWIEDYVEHLRDYPVLARTRPGEIKALLPKSPPPHPESFTAILADFEKIILPGITHWNHPRFFAYFSITGSYPGIIGELLSSSLNVNAMLWKTSPSATELEEVVLDWLRQMLGLPEEFEGVINDTASLSSLCAMAAAREYAGLEIRTKGLAGRAELPAVCMYTSQEAHSSIEKAAIVLGTGQDNLRKIPVDDRFRMDAHILAEAVQEDVKNGRRPLCVIATIGTTSTTSIDPVREIANVCREHGLWLHVDAAYGGAAALLPEMRHLFEGWERADSIVVNPHKWLATPIDCSVLYCRRPEVLRGAFSLVPEYLRTNEEGEVKNLMDYGVSLGRRFRSLKLWMVIRSLGREGIAQAIRTHIAFAARLAQQIENHPDFELLVPVPFSTLVFRYAPQKYRGDEKALGEINRRLLEKVNASGEVFLSHTKVKGKFGIRLSIGNFRTTWSDITLAWRILLDLSQKL